MLDPTTAEQVVRSFSVYTNGKKLFNTTSKGDEMACINGIKFISMIWVTLGHKYAFYLTTPLVNPLTLLTVRFGKYIIIVPLSE
jgi:hypothetical protein